MRVCYTDKHSETTISDGKPYCQNDYHALNGSLCATADCGRPIEGSCVSLIGEENGGGGRCEFLLPYLLGSFREHALTLEWVQTTRLASTAPSRLVVDRCSTSTISCKAARSATSTLAARSDPARPEMHPPRQLALKRTAITSGRP